MDIPLRVLLIEDSDRDVALEVRALKVAGYRVTYAVAETAAEMNAALIKQAFDIVLSDHGLPQFDAPGALALLKQSGMDIPFIIVSGAIGEETAVALMKAGAYDYVMKDRLPCLASAVERALKDAESLRGRKQAEEALKETLADLERSNRDLEQFAYVASHDLQEPLRMVASYTQLIARRYKDKLDADANEFIGFAVDGARRMQKMIDDLLSYSRVGTRHKPFEAVDWTALLNQVVTNLKLAIEETGAVITHDRLPVVRGDHSQLILLFQNLIGNAIKFRGEEAPRIHISATHESRKTIDDGRATIDPLQTQLSELKEGWTFSVKDNGIGIDPQYKERIFLTFTRLHGREEYPGNGIGLAVCKKIVEYHKGRIWMESEPGKGSIFYFTFPEAGVLK